MIVASERANADRALRRELYFFTLYRVLEACLLALMLFSPRRHADRRAARSDARGARSRWPTC